MENLERLIQIAEECDSRGLFRFASEIDDIIIEDSMQRLSKKRTLLEKLLEILQGEPPEEKHIPEHMLPKFKFEDHLPPKDMSSQIMNDPRRSSISNLSNRFAQVDDPFGDEMTDEERMAFLAREEAARAEREQTLMQNMTPEELKFYLENGMTIQQFNDQQRAEIEAEQGMSEHNQGFFHGGDDERQMEDEMGLESFENFMDRAFGPDHRNANRRIDSSMNRSAQLGNLPSLLRQMKKHENREEGHGGTPDRGKYDETMRGVGDAIRDLPSDDPGSPDFVSDEELEAASGLLESLLSGKMYEGKEFCPECSMEMKERDGEKYCPHCKLKESNAPRISSNMGDLGRIREASQRTGLSSSQKEAILATMR